MSILAELSSSIGERTEDANRAVAEKVRNDLQLLDDIAQGLTSSDVNLVGDCAEVITMIAEDNPTAVVPYLPHIPNLLKSKKTRVRWESMHTVLFVAREVPTQIEAWLPLLADAIEKDKSVIVRDYAVRAIAEYAATGIDAAQKAFPHLIKAVSAWDGKQAHHALNGLRHVVILDPSFGSQACEVAVTYTDHKKAVVRKAANALLKVME